MRAEFEYKWYLVNGKAFINLYVIVIKSEVVTVRAVTAHGRMEVYIHAFLDLGSGWGERPPSRRGVSSAWEWAACTLEAGSDPRSFLDSVDKGRNLSFLSELQHHYWDF